MIERSKLFALPFFAVAILSLTAAAEPNTLASAPARISKFAGHWVGTGMVTDVTGQKSNCSTVDIVMKQNGDHLITQSYSANCPMFSTDWGPDEMVIKGEKVFDQGDEIGTLTGNSLQTTEPINGVDYIFNLQVDTPTEMHSTYGVHNFASTIMVDSELHRVD